MVQRPSPTRPACERLDGDQHERQNRRPLRERRAIPEGPARSGRDRSGQRAGAAVDRGVADAGRRLCRPSRPRPSRAGVGDRQRDRAHLDSSAAELRDGQLPRSVGSRRSAGHRAADGRRRSGEPRRLRRHDRVRQPRVPHGRPGLLVPRTGLRAAAAQCACLTAAADHRRDRAEGHRRRRRISGPCRRGGGGAARRCGDCSSSTSIRRSTISARAWKGPKPGCARQACP